MTRVEIALGIAFAICIALSAVLLAHREAAKCDPLADAMALPCSGDDPHAD